MQDRLGGNITVTTEDAKPIEENNVKKIKKPRSLAQR
jgi:hypothetical protein